jgi:hypothetical protein
MSKKLGNMWSDNEEEDDSYLKDSDFGTYFKPEQRAKQRNAWGLLVYPIADTGKFIRVGIFRISFEQGGLRAFDKVPVSLVKLI